MNHIVRRYIFFLAGLFVNSLGVAFITRADLGTSPISSVPYVLSLNFSFTLGQYTMIFSAVLVLLQILILRKDYKPIQLLQLIVGVLFGYFIDFSMDVLLSWIHADLYVGKIIYLLIGCAILGYGVFMEVAANVLMLPGEGLANAIHIKSGRAFGMTKVCVDVSFIVCAALLSLLFAHKIAGVREGTVISAVLVGTLSRFYGRLMKPVTDRLFPADEKQ
ncbi:MAG: DUF6198 family protein [Lachnospiraceae bacterium]|nr:DUF6198 family protein [Lachnospiraceae bacterium]